MKFGLNAFKIVLILVISDIKLVINASNSKRIMKTEKGLINKILRNYDKFSRPADTVEIKFSLYLNQIVTLIEQDQIFVINVFLDHEWLDERLKWNPAEYCNISLLRINSELLWT